MSAYKTFHDGLVVVPAVPTDALDAWHLPPATEAAVGAPEIQTGAKWGKRRSKKAAGADDGKAGIPGAVFNLANAVRERREEG